MSDPSTEADQATSGVVQATLAGEIRSEVVNMENARTWDVNIGRADGGSADMGNTDPVEPGWLGNPYPLAHGYTREQAVDLFREDFIEKLRGDDGFRAAVDKLEGKTLGCYCKPEACHGDVIVAYLRGELDV